MQTSTSPCVQKLHMQADLRAQARYDAGPGAKRPRGNVSKEIAKKERKKLSAYLSRFRREALEVLLTESVSQGVGEISRLTECAQRVERENAEIRERLGTMQAELAREREEIRQAEENACRSPGSVTTEGDGEETEGTEDGLGEGVEEFLMSGLTKVSEGWSLEEMTIDPGLDLAGVLVVNASAR